MTIRLRVYGNTPDDLRIALIGPWYEKLTEFVWALERAEVGNYAPDDSTPPVLHADDYLTPLVHQNDLLLCFVDPATEHEALRFVSGVIKYHGAFTYLPTVLVGAERGQQANQFAALGVARLLQADVSAKELVTELARTQKKVWWSGLARHDLPALVLDSKHAIIRANDRARGIFGEDLVGRSYFDAIERLGSEIPVRHPVLTFRKEPRVVSEDRILHPQEGPAQRYFAIFSPIYTTDDQARGTAVLMLDLSHGDSIIHASARFAKQTSADDLQRAIVEEVGKLGFERARLYHVTEEKGEPWLRLQTVYGYSEDKREELEGAFEIEVGEDKFSQNTMRRHTPGLWVRVDSIASTARSPGEGGYTQYFEGEPNYAVELDKVGIQRWIEVPLWLTPPAPAARQFWGKLSVDRGRERSHLLDSRDVTELMLFGVVAANALADRTRQDGEKTRQKAVRTASERVVTALRMDDALPHVVSTVLHLFAALSDANVLVYRELHPDYPDTLRQVGAPNFYPLTLRDGIQVPHFFRSESLTTDFPVLADSKVHFLSDVRLDLARFGGAVQTDEHGKPLQPKEADYLRAVRSEIQIPIFRGAEVHGVVSAVYLSPQEWDGDTREAIERQVYVASSWIELAHQHSGSRWSEKVLNSVLQLLPELAAVPLDRGDVPVFAGLACLLSAHDSLRFNRVLVYSCLDNHYKTARLSYALGGLANQQNGHRTKQERLATDDPGYKLENVFRIRLETPCLAEAGGEDADSLYCRCVAEPRGRGRPLELTYGDDLTDPHSPGRFLSPRKAPPSSGAQTVDPQWLEAMNAEVPGMFAPKQIVYAFPLWCVSDRPDRPLGLVLVDNQRPPAQPLDQMLRTAGVVVGLVSSILSARDRARRMKGWHRALPVLFHGDELSSDLTQFIFAFEKKGGVEKVSGEVRGLFDRMKQKVERAFHSREPDRGIADLAAHLDAYVRALSTPHKLRDGKTMEVRRCFDRLPPRTWIACPAEILSYALTHLIGNAVTAFLERSERKNLVVEIDASSEPVPEGAQDRFDSLVRIYVSDNGPGLPNGTASLIGISGATQTPYRPGSRGLALIGAQLIEYHGVVRLDESLREAGTGCTFELRFGIPRGVDDDKIASGR